MKHYGFLFLLVFAVGCGSTATPPPMFDEADLQDPAVLTKKVKESLSQDLHADLDSLEISTGGNENIEFLVTVRGVIASSEKADQIKQAIEGAVASQQGQVEWLVTKSARQAPPKSAIEAGDSGDSGQSSDNS